MTQIATVERILDDTHAEISVPRKSACGHDCEECAGCGVSGISVPAVEEMLRSGRRHAYSGYGLLAIDDDVPAEKLFAAVESIRVKGKVLCRPEIKAHYGLK